MSVVSFDVSPPRAASPERADIALFVGYVGLRDHTVRLVRRAVRGEVSLATDAVRWLERRRLPAQDLARAGMQGPDIEWLLDVPVQIDSWEVFDHLFAWDRRPLEGHEGFAHSYLGAAVRSFFGEGGRSCYVVRVGDPWALPARGRAPEESELTRARRLRRIAHLLPGFPGSSTAGTHAPETWRGAGYVAGLPEVSFVCLPDLPDILRGAVSSVPPEPSGAVSPEMFLECSDAVSEDPDTTALAHPAPRLDDSGYDLWARALRHTADLLRQWQRQAQLIAALPLRSRDSTERGEDLRDVFDLVEGSSGGSGRLPVASSFVQLGFPWIRPGRVHLVPEGLVPPDGAVAGLLARNALDRGSFRNAASSACWTISEVEPVLPGFHLRPGPSESRAVRHEPRLFEHVSLVGRTPAGFALLSDVTLSADESYRSANTHRLVSAIVRAARVVGADAVFEPSGPDLWAEITRRLETTLAGFFAAGAFAGRTVSEAFQVRCDASTTRQQDLDDGRVIVEITFQAAFPIERILVSLALDASAELVAAGPLTPALASA